MSRKIYKNPLYYEIAFSFINPKKQADLFEQFIKKYSKIRVKRFLDIGCGPSLQLREIAKRGYEAIGLDSSSEMLKYLNEKAREDGIKIETVKANMVDFYLKKKADFAFIMMGTIGHIKSNDEFLAHLNSVANSLNKGGLYLIENIMVLDWIEKNLLKPQQWIMKRNGINIKTTFKAKLRDVLNQIYSGKIKLEINDHGRNFVLRENNYGKLIMPQELLTLIKLNNKFEFISWFERDKMKPLKKLDNNNIVLLRRK